MQGKELELEGLEIGRWTVLRLSGYRESWFHTKSGKRCHRFNTVWFCKCSCGTERRVLGKALSRALRGIGRSASTSCGCYQRERARETILKVIQPLGIKAKRDKRTKEKQQ